MNNTLYNMRLIEKMMYKPEIMSFFENMQVIRLRSEAIKLPFHITDTAGALGRRGIPAHVPPPKRLPVQMV